MSMEPMSEAWEDLGHVRKKPTVEKASIYKNMPPTKKFAREPDEATAERKKTRLDAIMLLASEVKEEAGSFVTVIRGKTFTFWPATDCWFSHSKQRFGYGIIQLLDLIEKKLK